MNNHKRYGANDLKQEIEHKTKKEKLYSIRQAIKMYNSNLSSIGSREIQQVYEPDFDNEAENRLRYGFN
jgi:hypothetical protein